MYFVRGFRNDLIGKAANFSSQFIKSFKRILTVNRDFFALCLILFPISFVLLRVLFLNKGGRDSVPAVKIEKYGKMVAVAKVIVYGPIKWSVDQRRRDEGQVKCREAIRLTYVGWSSFNRIRSFSYIKSLIVSPILLVSVCPYVGLCPLISPPKTKFGPS